MYRIHSIETAPEASRPGLERARKTYGFIPNPYGVFAESPAALDTQPLIREPGWLKASEPDDFFAAGYDQGQVLDVRPILALKTLSNYTNHIAETPLDTVFEPQRWEKRTQRDWDAGSPSAPHASILRAAR